MRSRLLSLDWVITKALPNLILISDGHAVRGRRAGRNRRGENGFTRTVSTEKATRSRFMCFVSWITRVLSTTRLVIQQKIQSRLIGTQCWLNVCAVLGLRRRCWDSTVLTVVHFQFSRQTPGLCPARLFAPSPITDEKTLLPVTESVYDCRWCGLICSSGLCDASELRLVSVSLRPSI